MLHDHKQEPIFISEQAFRQRFEYDPEKVLGEGGFARVFKAHDRQFDEVVALKFYSHREANKYDVMREMRSSRKFSHKNVIRVHEAHVIRRTDSYGYTEDVQVGVLEFANGGNLRDFLQTVPSEEQFKEVITGILEGLEYLHREKHTIHRDLSPDNVLMFIEAGRWTPKVADFGISKRLGVGTVDLNDQKLSSQLVGKIEYMAPEQFDPQKYGIDGKIATNVDLWAFGIILVEIFASATPFGDRHKSESPMQVMHNILHNTLPRYVQDIPEPYQRVVKCCLEKNAQKRAQTADELLEMIRQYQKKKKPKPPALLKTILGVTLLLGFGLLLFWLASERFFTKQTADSDQGTAPISGVKPDKPLLKQPSGKEKIMKAFPEQERASNDKSIIAEEAPTKSVLKPGKNVSPWDQQLNAFQRELNQLDNPEVDYTSRKQDIEGTLKKYFANSQVPVVVKTNSSENTGQPRNINEFLEYVVATSDAKHDREWVIMEAQPNTEDKIASLTVEEK